MIGFGDVLRNSSLRKERRTLMRWTKPRIVEICLGMEINCYACAEL